MLHVLTIILPVFSLMGLGFLAQLTGFVSHRAGEGLSEFVFSVAVPALIFKTLTSADLPSQQPWGYWLAYFGSVVVVWALATWLARRFFGVSEVEGVVTGFCAAQSNTVFVGVPLILEAYGPEGAVPLFLLIAIHLPVMVTAAMLLIEKGSADLLKVGRQLLTNPILLGILASVIVKISGLEVPGAVRSVTDSLGGAASPCALFAMGIALKRYGLGDHVKLATLITALKLLLHPLLVLVLARYVFPMPPVWAGVAVLFAAAPSGINAYLFAERYRTGIAIASGSITIGTVLSVLTTTFWLAVLGVH
jgi:malonate transporter and related proteins